MRKPQIGSDTIDANGSESKPPGATSAKRESSSSHSTSPVEALVTLSPCSRRRTCSFLPARPPNTLTFSPLPPPVSPCTTPPAPLDPVVESLSVLLLLLAPGVGSVAFIPSDAGIGRGTGPVSPPSPPTIMSRATP